MPWLVVLTSSAAPSSALLRWSHAITRMRDGSIRDKFLRALHRPVGQPNVAGAVIEQGDHDRTRRASCAENDDRACGCLEVRSYVAKAGEKAVGIGVEARQRAVVLHHDRVHRADPRRHRIDLIHQLEHRELVRDGDIAAGEAERPQAPDRVGQTLGLHRQRQICTGNAVLPEPMTVQHR